MSLEWTSCKVYYIYIDINYSLDFNLGIATMNLRGPSRIRSNKSLLAHD